MRSRGWGASRCLGGHPLIGTRSWDLRRIGRGRDRQTEKWTQGVCQRDKNRGQRKDHQSRSQRHRERDRGRNRGGTDGEKQRHKEMKQP